ncbi:hypothetical protein [Actinocatenispora rupis]|uniref:Uncharacterized protein n=1 Tax=Actinocatenispora rupis TaxID=519421 RepID=A0A8J3J753_9ACTN|nr:hypothetical protein [Actinocatenispora rupis]GID11382.1 hypothetical protein Aru02nite_22710 [Actinocatenispora rupis]
MAGEPEWQSAEARQAEDDARRQAERFEQAAREPEQQQEWLRQNNMVYGGLIAAGLVLVQPFLTVSHLDLSARICVLAFSVAIPLLAGLILLNRQESFRHRATDSPVVRVAKAVAQLLAFAGVVAGFWHITWLAGVGMFAGGVVAMMVHSAGHFRLELAARLVRPGARPRSRNDTTE